MPILLRTQDASFRELLAGRYAGFVGSSSHPRFEFDVDLVPPSAEMESDEDVHGEMQEGEWRLRRGDFPALWHPGAGPGRIRQSANPHSIHSVFRITHTLILAQEGGGLRHAASAVRSGRAFLF